VLIRKDRGSSGSSGVCAYDVYIPAITYMYTKQLSSIGPLIFGISLPVPEVIKLDAMTLSSRPLPGSLRPDDNIFFQSTSQRTQRLPDWLNHFSRKDLQVFFRCFVSIWVYTLFIVINPTLRALGTATFFGAIAIFIASPSGVIFIGLMTTVTLFLGISLAWAWGTIAMKAALATRPAEDLQRKYQLLQISAATDLSSQASAQEHGVERLLLGFQGDDHLLLYDDTFHLPGSELNQFIHTYKRSSLTTVGPITGEGPEARFTRCLRDSHWRSISGERAGNPDI
jgi:hypothetical protein